VRVPFFRVAERKEPKKGRPYTLRPFASLRATCGARSWGVPQNSLRACGAPFRQLRQVSSRSVCPAAHAHPTPCAPRRILKGWERTSTRAIASLGPARAARGACAREMRPSEAMARVAVRMFGSHPLLAAPAAGRLRGEHARLSAHAS
jgi:hypothetical protein